MCPAAWSTWWLTSLAASISRSEVHIEDDRSEWCRLLRTRARIADAQNGTGYRVQHPYTALLVNYVLGVPIGASPQLWKWMSAGNKARRTKACGAA